MDVQEEAPVEVQPRGRKRLNAQRAEMLTLERQKVQLLQTIVDLAKEKNEILRGMQRPYINTGRRESDMSEEDTEAEMEYN